jgi:hypothetical protein
MRRQKWAAPRTTDSFNALILRGLLVENEFICS